MTDPSPQRVLLIGYRGTGKTAAGRLLAARLGWGFADADDRIEAAAGKSIADIFAAEGEGGFRDREAAALADLCRLDRHVISTGGGAVLRPANRDRLRAAGFVAWLTADPETIWARLQADPTTAARRPKLTAAGGVEEVRELLAAREPLYRETASVRIPTATLSPEAVAAAILSAWTGGSTCRSSPGACSSSSSD
jgi:shikimate kinase